jgi:hypothetical protein
VLHISIDGLRPDHITQQLMPNLTAFLERSTHTMNARTDPAFTKTLPNHTSQLTGRPVFGGSGHGITYNEDMGRTVHTEAGEYVASVFDVVHDNGLRTAVYAGKSKFDMVDRNWNGQNGAVDTTGTNDGRDKLDFFLRDDPEDAVDPFVAELSRTSKLAYTFFHVRSPDEFGHSDTWVSPKPIGSSGDSSTQSMGTRSGRRRRQSSSSPTTVGRWGNRFIRTNRSPRTTRFPSLSGLPVWRREPTSMR